MCTHDTKQTNLHGIPGCHIVEVSGLQCFGMTHCIFISGTNDVVVPAASILVGNEQLVRKCCLPTKL
jgi:hypothetical protein